jgi:hypothetical protein
MLTPMNPAAGGATWLRFGALWLALAAFVLAQDAPAPAAAPPADEIEDDDPADVTKMAAFSVTADRLENFGFRVGGQLLNPFGSSLPIVTAVYPNTAASKAGLRPGDRVLTTDGGSAAVTLFSLSKWRKLFARKAAEIASGRKSVTWTLEVESPDHHERRTVKMAVPTLPPRWGATKWQPPEGRVAAVVEAGPLRDRARVVLDNGIWSNRRLPKSLGFESTAEAPLLGYEWSLTTATGERHRIFVTQQRGHTDIVFERSQSGRGYHAFLTSPAGALEAAVHPPPKDKNQPMSLEEGREQFQQEVDFWLNEVGRGTGRWPMEVLKSATAGADIVAGPSAPTPSNRGPAPMGQRAERFLKLTAATAEQRTLFADALAKLGAGDGQWAYTETSRGMEDKRVTVVRVDPSKADAERCTLLKLDGKVPTPAQVKQWREEGRDVSASLGDLPPIRSLVDVEDVRVVADETAAVVFELPMRGGNAQFPAEKFQALFRVNKTHRGFEDFAVKLRESFRVAGVVSVSEAGIEARFQTFDPTQPPQPVFLKAGGAVRVLLVKFARSFESSRTDYQRVTPYEESAAK